MKFKLTNISALQLFQLMRFGALMLIGIVFTKTSLTTQSIGEYEQFLFLAGAVSYFWLNGLIRGLLPLTKEDDRTNHIRFFNAFLLLSLFSLICVGLLSLLARPVSEGLLNNSHIKYLGLLVLYLVLGVPANLIEYFFLIRKEPSRIFTYGSISFSLMVAMIIAPSIAGLPITFSLYGLIVITILRYIFLWVILLRGGPLKVSFPFMKEHLRLSAPLILSAVLSGSAQYVDGFIVTSRFDEATFAVFRYGARELPLVLLLANAFSNAMLPEFGNKQKLKENLKQIKMESLRLANLLFPLSAILLVTSHFLFPLVFNSQFEESATIFNIYLLLITSRLLFPQTLLIGLKETSIIAWASFLELIVNVALSLWFVTFWGIEGIAYATIIAYLFEKAFLVVRARGRLNISLTHYQNIFRHLIYSLLLLAVFYLVEFVIY
ncbi:MAG TPA: oligosaccharide flippase family protein [Sunxiuqinia sp.]|nr:oligosaccharide flippase family protein [Sunxiuqinia sp.]